MTYIPVRFLIAIILAVLETLAVIAFVIVLCAYVPKFYLMVWATEISCIIQIIASDEHPDYADRYCRMAESRRQPMIRFDDPQAENNAACELFLPAGKTQTKL